MKKIVIAIIGVLSLCAIADAGGCVVRNRVVVHHQAAAVVAVQPVVAAVFAPIPVAVPAYSVGYSQSNLQEENERLKLEIKVQKLELQIQKLQSSPQPQMQPSPSTPVPQAQTSEHPASAILRKNCAACHDNALAKAKGGGFALTDGQAFARLTDKQALSVAREVYSGRMPKGSKLTDEEVGQIMSWLDTIK